MSSLKQQLEVYTDACFLIGFLYKRQSLDCNGIDAAAAELIVEFKAGLHQTLGFKLVTYAASFVHCLEDEYDKIEYDLYKLLTAQ